MNKKAKKITIITPCKNGQNHLKAHLEGILSQDYPNIEYIFVNDGSKDNTQELVLSYKEKFLKKGIDFKYLKQENKGQANAVNSGLKVMSGEYFSCIDSDDIINDKFCSKMSDFLEKNQQFSLVFPDVEVVCEKDFKHIEYCGREIQKNEKDTYFKEMIYPLHRNIPPYPCFMIKTRDFLKIYPHQKIYEGKCGQNPQFIMPFAYHKKIGYLKENLFKYVVRKNSDSRPQTLEERLIKNKGWEDLYLNSLESIPNIPFLIKFYYANKIKFLWAKRRKEILIEEDLRKYQQNFLFKNINKNQKIVFWGASIFLEEFLKKYEIKNKNIKGVVDINPDKQNKLFQGYKCFSPEEIKILNPDIIFVTIVNDSKRCYKQIKKAFKNLGLKKIPVKLLPDRMSCVVR